MTARPSKSAFAIVALASITLAGCQARLAPRRTYLAYPTVQVPLEQRRDYLFADAMINGEGPFTFLVDTGATSTILRSDVANELDLPRRSFFRYLLNSDSAHGPVRNKVYWVDELALADARFEDLTVAVVANEDFFQAVEQWAGDRVDGILGLDTFVDVVLVLDAAAPGMTLHQDHDLDDVIAFTGLSPIIPAYFGRGTDNEAAVDFMIDTGYSGSIAMPPSYDWGEPSGFGGAIGRRNISMQVGGIRTSVVGQLHTTFDVGAIRLDTPVLEWTMDEVRGSQDYGLVGMQVLKDTVISIDLRRQQLSIEPSPSSETP